jgi:hypothetical protein
MVTELGFAFRSEFHDTKMDISEVDEWFESGKIEEMVSIFASNETTEKDSVAKKTSPENKRTRIPSDNTSDLKEKSSVKPPLKDSVDTAETENPKTDAKIDDDPKQPAEEDKKGLSVAKEEESVESVDPDLSESSNEVIKESASELESGTEYDSSVVTEDLADESRENSGSSTSSITKDAGHGDDYPGDHDDTSVFSDEDIQDFEPEDDLTDFDDFTSAVGDSNKGGISEENDPYDAICEEIIAEQEGK